jgi:hypothetical protein
MSVPRRAPDETRAGAGPFEGHVVGDFSHLLRSDPGSAGPQGYRRAVRTPVGPEVLGIITDRVTRTWGWGRP